MSQENTALKESERDIQEVEVEVDLILTRITNKADNQDQGQGQDRDPLGKGLQALTSNKKVSTINQ